MKKCIIVFIFFILVFGLFFDNSYNAYEKETIVINLDYENDIVTLKDNNGFLWDFEGCEDWMIGDKCLCTFMNNYTFYTIKDDIIIQTIYKG